MSCATNYNRTNINYDNVQSYGKPEGDYAPLETAYDASQTMSDFQNQVLSANGNNAANIGMSLQSEEKINNNIEQLLGEIYAADTDVNVSPADQYISPDNCVYNTQYEHDPNLVENFNSTCIGGSCRSGTFWLKLLGIIILIAIIIYLIVHAGRRSGSDIAFDL